MREQAVEQVMAVLPDALGDNERCVGVQLAEHFHAHLLRINETRASSPVIGMRANGLPAFGPEALAGLLPSWLVPASISGWR
jgi:hypothetical protein